MRKVAGPALLALAIGLAACGGGGTDASTRDAHKTVHRYFAALAGGDAQGACAQMTLHSQEQLGEFGDALRLKSRSCAATLGALLKSPAAERLRTLRNAPVTKTSHHGSRITVRVDGVDRPIDLVHDAVGWRISSSPMVEADKLPGG